MIDVVVGDGVLVVCIYGLLLLIGDGVVVGFFIYLWFGIVLGVDGKLGVFVEVKNFIIGIGIKVLYLIYVGDVDIGEYSNIGVFSVFVNYDGMFKWCIIVGLYVWIGFDIMFVVLVIIGDGVYIGVGIVVWEDVLLGVLVVLVGL